MAYIFSDNYFLAFDLTFYSDILLWRSIRHLFWQSFRHSIWHSIWPSTCLLRGRRGLMLTLRGRRGTYGTGLALVARLSRSYTHTHNSVTHNSVRHNLTQLFHTQLCRSQLFHTTTLSHTILSHTALSHTTLSHTHTHNSFTHSCVTHNSFAHNSLTRNSFTHTQLCHTHNSFTRNSVTQNSFAHTPSTHNTFKHNSFTQSVFHHLLCLSCLSHTIFTSALCLLEEVDMWGYPLLYFLCYIQVSSLSVLYLNLKMKTLQLLTKDFCMKIISGEKSGCPAFRANWIHV